MNIGYATALKLLRMGATVAVTTRFPKDCLRRYSQEEDWDQVSFLKPGGVTAESLKGSVPKMDVHFASEIWPKKVKLDP